MGEDTVSQEINYNRGRSVGSAASWEPFLKERVNLFEMSDSDENFLELLLNAYENEGVYCEPGDYN